MSDVIRGGPMTIGKAIIFVLLLLPVAYAQAPATKDGNLLVAASQQTPGSDPSVSISYEGVKWWKDWVQHYSIGEVLIVSADNKVVRLGPAHGTIVSLCFQSGRCVPMRAVIEAFDK